jgi:hypothetical protein
LIGASDLDGSSGSLESVIGSEDNISLLVFSFSTNNNSMSALSSISIDMGT